MLLYIIALPMAVLFLYWYGCFFNWLDDLIFKHSDTKEDVYMNDDD